MADLAGRLSNRVQLSSDALAAYVEVSVEPIHLQTIFPVSLSSGPQNIAVGAQAVANGCYDQPTFPNQFCAQFQRAGPNGQGSAQPFQIIEGSLVAQRFDKERLRLIGEPVLAAKGVGIAGFFGLAFFTAAFLALRLESPAAPLPALRPLPMSALAAW